MTKEKLHKLLKNPVVKGYYYRNKKLRERVDTLEHIILKERQRQIRDETPVSEKMFKKSVDLNDSLKDTVTLLERYQNFHSFFHKELTPFRKEWARLHGKPRYNVSDDIEEELSTGGDK